MWTCLLCERCIASYHTVTSTPDYAADIYLKILTSSYFGSKIGVFPWGHLLLVSWERFRYLLDSCVEFLPSTDIIIYNAIEVPIFDLVLDMGPSGSTAMRAGVGWISLPL